MRFAAPLSPWLTLLAVLLAGVVVYRACVRPGGSLSQRLWLSGLRALSLLLLLVCLAQPVRLVSSGAGQVVPVLIDHSRSMAVADVDGRGRLEAAVSWVAEHLDGELVTISLFGVGDGVMPVAAETVPAEVPRSRLRDAVMEIRERYPAAPAVVLLTDGGETGETTTVLGDGPPVFTLGVGARSVAPDQAVVDLRVAAGVTAASAAELSVTFVARGYAGRALEVRVLEDGRLLRVLEATADDDVPVLHRLAVAPPPERATRYTVELPVLPGETVAANNRRSVLVPRAARPRRVLFVEGGPGYEHSFLKRVLRADDGVEVDAVIEKGRNDRGERTFYIQSRAPSAGVLAQGFPETVEALFRYDAVILANLNVSLLRPVQAEMLRDFVSERGGGLLVLGTRAVEGSGWRDLGLADLLPLVPEVGGRQVRFGGSEANRRARLVSLADGGHTHPITQLGPGDLGTRWRQVPPLGAVARLGPAAPGATVLLHAQDDRGGLLPAVAVQRLGAGRVMLFAADASWRWQMLAEADDDTYERFWRQATRWLADESPEPLEVEVRGGRAAGDAVEVRVHARDPSYAPRHAAQVSVRFEGPDGRVIRAPAVAIPDEPGRYLAVADSLPSGVHRVTTEVQGDTEATDRAESVALVGGADPELAEPGLQESVLEQLAVETGGRRFDLGEAPLLREALAERLAARSATTAVELWDMVWVFVLLVGLLSAEWALRRRWGLR